MKRSIKITILILGVAGAVVFILFKYNVRLHEDYYITKATSEASYILSAVTSYRNDQGKWPDHLTDVYLATPFFDAPIAKGEIWMTFTGDSNEPLIHVRMKSVVVVVGPHDKVVTRD